MGVSAGRGRPEWHVLDLLEHDFEGSPMPHAIISVVSDVTADDADQSLTSCEVTAIVATMICRTSHGHCLDGRVHPVSNQCDTRINSIY